MMGKNIAVSSMVNSKFAASNDIHEKMHSDTEWRWKQEVTCQNGFGYSPRTGHVVVEYDGFLYLFGGTDEFCRRNDLHRYHIQQNKWEKIETFGDIPSPRSSAAGIVTPDGLMYIFGGYSGYLGVYYNDLYCLNLKLKLWSRVYTNPNRHLSNDIDIEKPAPRIDHCMAYYQDSLIVFGGVDGTCYHDDTYRFNLRTHCWTKLVKSDHSVRPGARFGHAGIVHEDYLWVFGGWNGESTLNNTWRLDIIKEEWKSLDTLRNERTPLRINGIDASSNSTCGSSVISASRKPFLDRSLSWQLRFIKALFIGSNEKGEDQQSRYDDSAFPQLDAGERFSGPSGRYRHSAVVTPNHMVIFGGVNKLNRRFNDVWKLNLSTLEWTELKCSGAPPKSRTFHRAVVYNGRMIVVGGYDGNKRLNDTFSINLGAVRPNTLFEMSTYRIRENFEKLVNMGEPKRISTEELKELVWDRDSEGSLRGGRDGLVDANGTGESIVPLCPGFRRRTVAYSSVYSETKETCVCAICSADASEHDLVLEKKLNVESSRQVSQARSHHTNFDDGLSNWFTLVNFSLKQKNTKPGDPSAPHLESDHSCCDFEPGKPQEWKETKHTPSRKKYHHIVNKVPTIAWT